MATCSREETMGHVRDTTGRLYAQWVVSKEVRVGRGEDVRCARSFFAPEDLVASCLRRSPLSQTRSPLFVDEDSR